MGVADWVFRRLHWWLAGMAVLYLTSGVTVVQPDQVALVLRMGKLRGVNPAEQVHGPGLLLALPRPIDEVVRVPTEKIFELELNDLHWDDGTGAYRSPSKPSIDPEREGYVLTADHNLLHARIVVRYRIADPIAYALYQPQASEILRAATVSSFVRTAGETPVDQALTEGRAELVNAVQDRAQARLDAVHAGIEITAVELTDLSPPTQVRDEFNAVQSSYIDAETQIKAAVQYQERELPAARGDANREIRGAEGDAAQMLATARGDADAFVSLVTQMRGDAGVTRSRLYREGVEDILDDAGLVRFVPPPAGSRYSDFRITLAGAR